MSSSTSSSPIERYSPFQQPGAHAQSRASSSSTSTYHPPTSPRNRYPSHPGCVLCSLVSATPDILRPTDELSADAPSPSPTATTSFLSSSPMTNPTTSMTRGDSSRPLNEGMGRTEVNGKDVVYWDEEITIYKASGRERLTAEGKHLIVVMNRHVESVYDLGPSDVPVLSRMVDSARQVLAYQHGTMASEAERGASPDIRIGFVGNLIRDSAVPHKHLHAHAMAGPIDRSAPGAGIYRRNVVFGNLNWWSIDDLRAEIREESSNNRVKSGYKDRTRPPIERVPDAGSRTGLPNAMDSDPYAETPPPSSPASFASFSRLHPDDARDGRHQRYTDRKGKASTVPRRPLESVQMDDSRTVSSNGSENGDEEGYVAVNLK